MRDHFHVPNNYFLSHSVGCLPKSTPDVLERAYFKPWRETGGKAWGPWMDIAENFRAGIGSMLGVKPANICPQSNVSSALTKILYSLPKRDGRNVIVLSEQDFPTIGFVMERAKTAGFDIRYVRGDVTDPQGWADAINDHTALVHITHALSNTSHVLPVDEICELASRAKSISVVDVAQSIGVLQIKTNTWEPDFIIGTSVKFICGGPGACFLYASDAMLDMCEPLDVGWFSHENPFEMDINHFQFASDAMKFFGGTPSPAPLATASNAINVWRNCGIFEAQIRVQDILDGLVSAVPADQLISPLDPELRGGTLVINPVDRARFQTALDNSGILSDVREEGFRFSVHGYTSDADVNVLKSVFKTAL